MFVELVIKSKTRMTDKLFTYHVPTDIECQISVGQRVLVPFGRGNKAVVAIVVGLLDTFSSEFELKDVIKILDNKAIINEELIELALYMAEEYLSDYSSAFQSVLPPGDLFNIQELYYQEKESEDFKDFFLKARTYDEVLDEFKLSRSQVNKLVESKELLSFYKMDKDASIKTIKYVELINTEYKISKSAHKQKAFIEYLSQSSKVELKQAMQEVQVSSQTVNGLVEKGYIKITEKEVYREVIDKKIRYEKHELNPDQKRVYDGILASDKTVSLLHGVTGSGKTEIYLQLSEHIMNQGKQVLVLVPEISLTPQTIERFSGRFGEEVAVLHSKLSISERFDQWRKIKEGQVKMVVGTRSSIFAPFDNIGLIIIDEEHDKSYVSDKNPKYDAGEIAYFRAKYHGAKVLLGTATPKVESFYKVKNELIDIFTIKKRANNSSLPEVSLVDMRDELMKKNFSMFSGLLHEEIEKSLERGKQVILFLNKRGHTSFIFCRKCGYSLRCEDCDVALTYHKSKNLAICHYCGKTSKKPVICPKCGSNAIKEFGAGTEKLEEETKQLFPQARVMRMDADTMSKKGSYQKMYDLMSKGEIDILIGTQMLSKGFDFKNVDLVGVMSADISINLPDFRSAETSFQLLTQVAGRAGRGEDGGKVIIQSYQPGHYSIQSAKNHDFEAFYESEIKVRKAYKYPPFYDVILIRVSHVKMETCIKTCNKIIKTLDLSHSPVDFEIIGPNPATIERIRNRFRYNIIIKTKGSLEKIKKILLEKLLKNPSFKENGVRIYLAINPVSVS